VDSGKVNINTATKEQLVTLPGIGESKADSIIAYRTEHGSFSSIEEIMEIPGIKEAVFSKIKELITVG
jgi:competence protein ComEA